MGFTPERYHLNEFSETFLEAFVLTRCFQNFCLIICRLNELLFGNLSKSHSVNNVLKCAASPYAKLLGRIFFFEARVVEKHNFGHKAENVQISKLERNSIF